VAVAERARFAHRADQHRDRSAGSARENVPALRRISSDEGPNAVCNAVSKPADDVVRQDAAASVLEHTVLKGHAFKAIERMQRGADLLLPLKVCLAVDTRAHALSLAPRRAKRRRRTIREQYFVDLVRRDLLGEYVLS